MKYYELYADLYWMAEPKLHFQELNVVKDTAKQLQISHSRTFLSRVNKSELMTVKESGSNSYIMFHEGQEKEARELLKESVERNLNYHQKKVDKYKSILKEI